MTCYFPDINTYFFTAGDTWQDSWKYRYRGIADLISRYDVDIVAFQEPHYSQTCDIASILTGDQPLF